MDVIRVSQGRHDSLDNNIGLGSHDQSRYNVYLRLIFTIALIGSMIILRSF